MSTQRFDIQHAPAPRESFRLLYISKSRFGGDWNSTTHTHSCTELFYCLPCRAAVSGKARRHGHREPPGGAHGIESERFTA